MFLDRLFENIKTGYFSGDRTGLPGNNLVYYDQLGAGVYRRMEEIEKEEGEISDINCFYDNAPIKSMDVFLERSKHLQYLHTRERILSGDFINRDGAMCYLTYSCLDLETLRGVVGGRVRIESVVEYVIDKITEFHYHHNLINLIYQKAIDKASSRCGYTPDTYTMVGMPKTLRSLVRDYSGFKALERSGVRLYDFNSSAYDIVMAVGCNDNKNLNLNLGIQIPKIEIKWDADAGLSLNLQNTWIFGSPIMEIVEVRGLC